MPLSPCVIVIATIITQKRNVNSLYRVFLAHACAFVLPEVRTGSQKRESVALFLFDQSNTMIYMREN